MDKLLNKKFEIQKHIFQMLRLLSTIAITIAFGLIAFPFLLKGDYSLLRAPVLKFSLVASPLFFLLSILFDRISALLRKTNITVTDSTITYEGFGKRKCIHFVNVERFKFVKTFPFGVRGYLTDGKVKIDLPLYFDELSELIKFIRKSLNVLSKSDAYKNGNIVDFDLRARYNDLISDLMYLSVPYLLTTFTMVLALDIIMLLHFWDIPLIFGLLWIVQSLFFPGAAYLISFINISGNIKNSIRENPELKTLPHYSSVFIYSGIIFTILYLISGIALKYLIVTQWFRF